MVGRAGADPAATSEPDVRLYLKGVLASNRFKSLVEQNGLRGLIFKPVG